MIDELFAPDLGVTGAATFEQHHDRGTFEASRNIAWMHALAHDFCELRENLFRLDDSHLFTYQAKAVGFDIDKTMRAGCGLAFQSFGNSFEKLRSMEKQHRRVAFERIVYELGWLFCSF